MQIHELYEILTTQSTNLIKKHNIKVFEKSDCIFKDKEYSRNYIAKQVELNYDWAEFGVAEGESAKIWINYISNKLFLFDSFDGLPEDWIDIDGTIPKDRKGNLLKRGYFKCCPPIFNNDNVDIVKGLFENTVPMWIKKHKEPLAFIHIDCDLYSSTKCVLDNIFPLLTNGTIVFFDELYGESHHISNEWKAFQEFASNNKIEFDCILISSDRRVGIKIKK